MELGARLMCTHVTSVDGDGASQEAEGGVRLKPEEGENGGDREGLFGSRRQGRERGKGSICFKHEARETAQGQEHLLISTKPGRQPRDRRPYL